jgi:surface protein
MNSMFDNATAFDQNLGNWNVSQVTNMNGMLNNITLSTANYDATLIGWDGQMLHSGINLNAGSSTYSTGGAADAAHAHLISNFGWTISDGGGI